MCCRFCKATRQGMLAESAAQPPPYGARLTIASHLVSIAESHFLAQWRVPRDIHRRKTNPPDLWLTADRWLGPELLPPRSA